jgi:hypothetical protein
MPSVVNARWKHSTIGYSPLPLLITGALWARPLAGTLDAESFSCRSESNSCRSIAHTVSRRLARPTTGEGGENRRAVGPAGNALAHVRYRWYAASSSRKPPCPTLLIFHQHNAVWTRSALLAISDASGGRPSGPGRPCSRHTRTNGLARSPGHLGRATVITEENCASRCRQSADMSKRNLFHSARP